ncbi:MAG: PAS domain-containing sensor histidine kinase [Halovenus sp.]
MSDDESTAGPDDPELLANLVERTEDGLFVIDASGQLSFVNSSFADLLGYEREQLLGTNATVIFPEEHFEAVEEQVRAFGTGDKDGLRRELVLERSDGTGLTVAVELAVRETAAGRYAGLVGAARDVTADKNRANELERYETIVQAVSDPVCTLDRDGRFCYVNDSFETTTGYETETALEETLELIFDDEDVDAVQQAITDVSRQAEDSVTTVEVGIQTKDGSTVPTECRITTIPTGAEDPQAVVAVLHDISRLKQRERRLSKFASVVSHDLRNPMDVALGRAEMLPEVADVDPETEAHLDDIYESVKRMERIIQDVLTLTRQRGDGFETEPVSLSAVAEDAWNTVATESATLSVETGQVIEAHRSRLVQLLENLFRNAIQHGGEEVTVTIERLGSDEESVGFRISDDGAGIPKEHTAEIFDDGFTTRPEGTGLGLAIVREVVGAHDWEIQVQNTADSGAQFDITGVSVVEE